MKLIKADHDRRLEIPGVPHPVQRPVDIDKSQTGFAQLRSLRIYRFAPGSCVNGHAEEDEVLIVVLAGTIQLTLIGNSPGDSPRPFTLAAAGDVPDHPCAAYLPPQAAYRLIPQTGADVAYARATPAEGPPTRVFHAKAGSDSKDVALLWEETTYPRLLRVRLLQIRAVQHDIAIKPIEDFAGTTEALIHVRLLTEDQGATLAGTDAVTIPLASWDTVAVTPSDHPTLGIPIGTPALVLIVLAVCDLPT